VKVAVVLGTRPEIIKMYSVVDGLKRVGVEVVVLFTGQHFSDELGRMMFDFLGYCESDLVVMSGFDVLSGMFPAIQTADLIMVHGDTTSTVLGAVAAIHNKKPLAHVEAGLRSFDFFMREERNRKMVDQAADILFCPLVYHVDNCNREHCMGLKHAVGNTIVDVVRPPTRLNGIDDDGVVITLHRRELVDDVDRFCSVVRGIASFLRHRGVRAVYPMHPGVRDAAKGLDKWVLDVVEIVDPVSPIRMWDMISHAPFVVTDSGGLQEEACILGVPCFTIRDNTERPETLKLGANVLIRPVGEKGVFEEMLKAKHRRVWKHPYGKDVGKKIALLTHGFWSGGWYEERCNVEKRLEVAHGQR